MIRRTSAPVIDHSHMQHQALASIFVHQGQALERTASGGPICDKVARPDIVLEPGRLIDATIGAQLLV